MKSLAPLVGSLVAAALLGGCAYDEGYHHHGMATAGVDYDGYYDDYYGRFADGYWGPDDFFYFSDAPGHPFRRDDGRHFRHDSVTGFHPIHGHHEGGAPREGGAPHEGTPPRG